MTSDRVALATAWAAADPDPATRAELEAVIASGDEAELARRVDAPLTFGTAGLRGPVMAGPAGMNRLTVRRATQGVVAWMAERGLDPARGVVVGRDARRGSEAFNDEVVGVLLGAGVTVHEMPGPLPTPITGYAVKALGAAAGVMVTASHNPPADNGYKLYAPDGSQIIPPDDEIVERFSAAAGPAALGDRSSPLHHTVSESLLGAYRAHLVGRFGGPSDLRVAYTPLHGVGGATMTRLFAEAGFGAVAVVAEQFEPDGAFPTLPFPNPEEPGALDLATALGTSTGADVVVANDPDADRLGVAVRSGGAWRALSGDEIGWLLASYLLPSCVAGDVVATSIVSSSMLEKMAAAAGVGYAQTLTGFKWVGRAAGPGRLAFGYEEALGYAVDSAVADKDGMSAALAFCRLATELKSEGRNALDRLDELATTYGVHATGAVNVRAEGESGLAAIAATVARLAANPPTRVGGFAVTEAADLSAGWRGLPPTTGVRWQLGDTGRVVVRPSGTEPKLKAYVEVVTPAEPTLAAARGRAATTLAAIRADVTSLTTVVVES